ncbi:MAG: TetR/AcrR family transcriptional regulator [Ruminococcaceae bacterium]|nr:TetR/AcrR family transcriptional regulator [Oscillospiraceae bacterium]
MANIGHSDRFEKVRKKLLYVAAKQFLQKGYTMTSLKDIAAEAGTNTGVLMRTFGSKENILAALVKYVLNEQFYQTSNLLKGKIDDKILFYAAETTLQLHIVESDENIREMYGAAYSLPSTTQIIQQTITGKLESIFSEHLPHLETKDFYELEIASGGIMRGFMTIPCDMYFTMDRKIKRFLETTFLVYRVSDEKIKEAIDFVSQFDFKQIAQDLIQSMLRDVSSKA